MHEEVLRLLLAAAPRLDASTLGRHLQAAIQNSRKSRKCAPSALSHCPRGTHMCTICRRICSVSRLQHTQPFQAMYTRHRAPAASACGLQAHTMRHSPMAPSSLQRPAGAACCKSTMPGPQ